MIASFCVERAGGAGPFVFSCGSWRKIFRSSAASRNACLRFLRRLRTPRRGGGSTRRPPDAKAHGKEWAAFGV